MYVYGGLRADGVAVCRNMYSSEKQLQMSYANYQCVVFLLSHCTSD